MKNHDAFWESQIQKYNALVIDWPPHRRGNKVPPEYPADRAIAFETKNFCWIWGPKNRDGNRQCLLKYPQRNRKERLEMTLEKLLEIGYKQVHHMLVELKSGQLIPMFLLVNSKEEGTIIGTPWRNNAEKDATIEHIRQYIQENDIQVYSLICEGWAIERKSLNPDEKPSQAEDRIEVVNIIAVNRQERRSVIYRIVRADDGTVKSLIKNPEGIDVGGPFTELFGPSTLN